MRMNQKSGALRGGVSNKLQHLRHDLFFVKMAMLHKKGLREGTIAPFDEDFYKQMSQTYIEGLPVSMRIKYMNPAPDELGECYERSKYMFYCFDDALLVRGDLKILELKYDSKESAGHGWLEIGDQVYDPNLLRRFNKDLYYEMYGVSNVIKYSKEQYFKNEAEKKLYDEVRNTTLEDFRPGGKKHYYFKKIIPMVLGYARYANKTDFMKELDAYLSSIKFYDEQQLDSLLQDRGLLTGGAGVAGELDKQM